ncbi:hypothetical protein D3C76_1275170 [compost metagenome]
MIDVNGRISSLLIPCSTEDNRNCRSLKSLNMFFSYRTTHEEQTIDLFLQKGIDDTDFLFFTLIRVTQYNIVMIHVRDIFNPACNFCKNRV